MATRSIRLCPGISGRPHGRSTRPPAALLATLLALLAPPTAGAAAIASGSEINLLGWSGDGQYIAWTHSDSASSAAKTYFLQKGRKRVRIKDPEKLPEGDRAKLVVKESEEDMQQDETVSLATVRDVRSGDEKRFLLSYKALTYEGTTKGALKQKYAGLPDAAAFEAWKKAHALVRSPARQGPRGGRAEVSVKVQDDQTAAGTPKWKRNTISWSVDGPVKVTLAAARDKDRGQETIEQTMEAMYAPTWSGTPFWDPTGRRVLFLLEEEVTETMRGPAGGKVELYVVPCAPRVEVLAPAGLEGATGRVADAVEKAGFAVVATGAARQPRQATVVYAPEAHAESAARIAAAVPGGATVEKLTWRPKADVVVAIGDSAR
jgi:hypothetical protein